MLPLQEKRINNEGYQMRVLEIDGYYMSATGGVNKFMQCDDIWFNKNILRTTKKIASNPYYLNIGNRVHDVEENFWNVGIALRDKIFPLSYLKLVTRYELRKRMTSIKKLFIGEFETELLDYMDNLSDIDAEEFFKLKDHFDGDVEQARKYWIPLEMEYNLKFLIPVEIDNDLFYNGIHVKIDNLILIPRRYRNYKNKKDALLVKDYKPGKIVDGKPKPISRNGDYGYRNDFQRQLTFYATHINYEIDGESLDCDHVAGAYYKTRQYVVDKLTKRQINPLNKKIDEIWNKEKFQRRKVYNSKYDWCKNFCEYRLTCRYTRKMVTGEDNGKPYKLYQHCVRLTCKTCRKSFIIPKSWLRVPNKSIYKNCNYCRVIKDGGQENSKGHIETRNRKR
jgi:hypothetical protein